MFLWIKLLHILAMTSWMAGIFYLPRIYVHYVEGRVAGQDVARLEIMARKLFGFMTLMALLTLIFGLWLWLGYVSRWLDTCKTSVCWFFDWIPWLVF